MDNKNMLLLIEKQLKSRKLTPFALFLECYTRLYGSPCNTCSIEVDARAYVNNCQVPRYVIDFYTQSWC